MYEYFEGRIKSRRASSLVLDVNGVGYAFQVPPTIPFPSQDCIVWAHLHVREDAQILYGFPDHQTRELFRLLLRVRGVGPAMALGLLASLDRQDLIGAILNGEASVLTRVKGVGKRTADQILLDLTDRIGQVVPDGDFELRQSDVPRPDPKRERENEIEDAVLALVSVGYSEKDGRKRVERVADSVEPGDLEQLVRAALQT
ncbi:MAG: Holliday junction DNA helicase RuvA [Planctomycetota bacterium]|jgi:Holliday junction DNA helicase RuvA